MLKFSEMKTKTKVFSGVLMSAMILGAAAPSMANVLSEPKIIYDDPWDMPAKTGSPINTLVSVHSEDDKNFTEEEWAEIMRRVETGTIEYVEITEEHRELEAFLKKHNIPPFMTSAPNELPLPSLTIGEKLALFQYYVENDCTGNLHCDGDLNATTGEYEITTSCYNREGDLIVSHDLGETWELASEDDRNYWMDSARSAPKEEETYPELSSSELEKVFLYYSENDCTGEIRTNVKVIETTGEELIVVSLYNKYAELMMSYDRGETWELASEDDWNYWMDAGEIEMLQEGNQGIEIVPVDVRNDLSIAQEIFKAALFDVAMSAENPENCTVTWHSNSNTGHNLTIQAEEGRDFSDGDVFIRLAKIRETLPPTVIDLIEEIPFAVTIILDENKNPQLRAHDVFWAEHLGLNMIEA